MSLNILVVDDQKMIRQIHAQMLLDAGHAVQTATNGREGLEMFRQFRESCPFDLIMTDEEMPEMIGIEMCEIIYREVSPGFPIIMISSLEDIDLMTRLMRMGIAFFRKPLRKEDLYPYLESVEQQIKLKKERDKRAEDHKIAERYLIQKSFELQLDNNVNIHEPVMKYILDVCEHNGIGEQTTFRVHFGLTETLINAVAHGNLEMGSAEFKKDGNFTLWENEIARRQTIAPYASRHVKIQIEILLGQSVRLTIADEGQGFDHRKVLSNITADDIYQAFGRGLVMLKSIADELEFNEKGNCVTMLFKQPQD